MSDLPVAYEIRRASDAGGAADHRITLTYDGRFLRRKRLVADDGYEFLVDLSETTSLNQHDTFLAKDGVSIEVLASSEDLIEVTGSDLVRLAWHIGNRHTPCQVEPARLLIQRDHVMLDMLGKLGATVREVCEPFTPEGGAYGHGRTHSHAH